MAATYLEFSDKTLVLSWYELISDLIDQIKKSLRTRFESLPRFRKLNPISNAIKKRNLKLLFEPGYRKTNRTAANTKRFAARPTCCWRAASWKYLSCSSFNGDLLCNKTE